MWQAIGAVLSLLSGWMQRRWKKADDPEEQKAQRKAAFDAAMARGDGVAASRIILERMRRKKNGDGDSG